MPTFENPEITGIYDRDELGTIWDAARVAGVKPGTILVWISRKKIEPMPIEGGQRLFHLPTVQRASLVRPGRQRAA
jgi:DNA-binding transcriptional MerR regulator